MGNQREGMKVILSMNNCE